jgi:hypothetical protein
VYQHTVSLTITALNVTGLTQATLLSALTNGVASGAGASSANVQVVITLLKIHQTYSGLPSITTAVAAQVAAAYANMTGTNVSLVIVTASTGGRRLGATRDGGRRLADGDIEAGVANTNGDAVGATQAALANVDDSTFQTKLSHQGITANVSGSSPTVSAIVNTVVSGSTNATLSETALQNAVAATTGGTVQASVTTIAITTSATTLASSSATSSDDSGAMSLVAPTMTIWAVMYALMMA